jgi:nucleoside 2-deoxyribosyltransferase
MKQRVVYLAGLISTDYPESLQWRLLVAPLLEQAGFEVRTPLAGKKNLKSETKDGGITTTVTTGKSITLRDYRDVSECDIMLTHLEQFGCPRPLVGTVAELAWAWQLRKPVVAIANTDNYLMRNHPFVSEFVSQYWPTVQDAVDYVIRYYGTKNSD